MCQDDAKVNLLLDKAPNCLRKLIVIKEIQPLTLKRAKARGIDVIKFEEVEELGASKNHNEVVSTSMSRTIKIFIYFSRRLTRLMSHSLSFEFFDSLQSSRISLLFVTLPVPLEIPRV